MNRKVSQPQLCLLLGEVVVVEDLDVVEGLDEVLAEDMVLQVVKLLDEVASLLANPPPELANLFDLEHHKLVITL